MSEDFKDVNNRTFSKPILRELIYYMYGLHGKPCPSETKVNEILVEFLKHR